MFKAWLIFFVLILFSLGAFAQVQIEPLGNQIPATGLTPSEIQVNQRLAIIESKLNAIPNADQISQGLVSLGQQILTVTNSKIDFAILTIAVLLLAQLGLLFFIYIYFITQRRLKNGGK